MKPIWQKIFYADLKIIFISEIRLEDRKITYNTACKHFGFLFQEL